MALPREQKKLLRRKPSGIPYFLFCSFPWRVFPAIPMTFISACRWSLAEPDSSEGEVIPLGRAAGVAFWRGAPFSLKSVSVALSICVVPSVFAKRLASLACPPLRAG